MLVFRDIILKKRLRVSELCVKTLLSAVASENYWRLLERLDDLRVVIRVTCGMTDALTAMASGSQWKCGRDAWKGPKGLFEVGKNIRLWFIKKENERSNVCTLILLHFPITCHYLSRVCHTPRHSLTARLPVASQSCNSPVDSFLRLLCHLPCSSCSQLAWRLFQGSCPLLPPVARHSPPIAQH